jgi:CII-binding regulator of phage lambda lysogenization HflD
MKTEQLKIELNQLMTELCVLEEQANLEKATTDFLGKETDKLLIKSQDSNLSLEERERVYNQMMALQGRLARETRALGADMKKLSELNSRLEYFQSLIIEE